MNGSNRSNAASGRGIVIVLCAGLLGAGCSAVQEMVPEASTALQLASEAPSFSDADEERMARENARKFEAEAEMWDEPLMEAYLTEITQRLVAVANPRPFQYRVRIVADPTVNAFTFGGGLVYVNAGLIARMENEAQLAMVLAHEIAHVTERHVPGGIEREFGLQVLGSLAARAAESTGALSGSALDQAYEYTMSAAINGHGRSQESEADRVGLRYMADAGYDPAEAPYTFQQLYEEYGDQSAIQNFFWGSHPTNRSRFETLTRLVSERYAGGDATTRIVNTEEFKRRTRQLVIAVGLADYEANRFADAEEMFGKAAAVRADDPLPHYYLGKIALETGTADRLPEARQHLADAIAADETFAPAYRELGLVHYRMGDREAAVAALEGFLEIAPDGEQAEQVREMIDELRGY